MVKPIEITAYDLAQRYVGVKEFPGGKDHPLVQWWLSLCGFGIESPDETPWCSAFVNGIAWELRLPRSKSAAARSWLTVGKPIPLEECQIGNDIVVIKRGNSPQPGAEVLQAPGHVGFFAGLEGACVNILGGNQGNSVSIARFPAAALLGARRLV